VLSNYILLNYLPYPSYLQTLDALPAHVLTPFIGPVPPSNLLDKIARGVSQAKGPSDWPYSLRSTRAKLVELCRVRAKEVSAEQKLYNTIEEEDMDQDLEQFREVLKRTTNIRRPLYRQNSMDFMQSAKLDLRRTDAFSRYVFLSSMYSLLVLISLRTFSDIELLIVSVILTTYSRTRPTIRAHRPLTLKLSMSLHPPPLR
jgi:hypothetical protein